MRFNVQQLSSIGESSGNIYGWIALIIVCLIFLVFTLAGMKSPGGYSDLSKIRPKK